MAIKKTLQRQAFSNSVTLSSYTLVIISNGSYASFLTVGALVHQTSHDHCYAG